MALPEIERQLEDDMKSPETSQGRLNLSPTVEEVLKRFGPEEAISSSGLVQAILDSAGHRKEYADGAFVSIELHETSERKPAQQWLDELRSLLEASATASPESGSTEPLPLRRGRAILDGRIRNQASGTSHWTTSRRKRGLKQMLYA